jgi:hypothetical protein
VAQRATMCMPETSVDEDDLAPSAEDQIRASWEIAAVKPVSISKDDDQRVVMWHVSAAEIPDFGVLMIASCVCCIITGLLLSAT